MPGIIFPAQGPAVMTSFPLEKSPAVVLTLIARPSRFQLRTFVLVRIVAPPRIACSVKSTMLRSGVTNPASGSSRRSS